MGLVRVLLVALAPHGADPFIAVVLAFAALRPVVDGASRAPAVAPFLAADGEEAPVRLALEVGQEEGDQRLARRTERKSQ